MNTSYGVNLDVQKVANLFGPHTFSVRGGLQSRSLFGQ